MDFALPKSKKRAWRPRYTFWPLLKPHSKPYLLGLTALLFTDLINVALPLVIKVGIDALESRGTGALVAAALGYFVLMVVQSGGRYAWRVYLIGTSFRVATELRTRLLAHLLKLPARTLVARAERNDASSLQSGDVLSRLTQDVDTVRVAVGPGILVAADAILMMILIVPPMLWLSPKLTLLALAFLPIVPVLSWWLGRKVEKQFEALEERLARMGNVAQEALGSVRFLKAWLLESHARKRFEEASAQYEREGVRLAKFEAPFGPSLGLLTHLGTLLLLFYGGREVLEGAITVGTFVAFQRYVVQLSWPMEAIGWMVTMHREGVAAYRRLESLERIPEEVATGTFVPASGRRVGVGRPAIDIRRLRFDFAAEKGFHLDVEELRLDRGARVALVGPVGSGKTTVLRLLQRLYEPSDGDVDLLGVPLPVWDKAALRRRVALVEQVPTLFRESIRDNLSLGLGKAMDDASIRALADIAAYSEVMALDLDAPLAERAADLSGGQRQRLALMRALARSPDVLLLDDCFSAVDVDVERRILERLFRDERAYSTLLVTHRQAALDFVDEVWVLDAGRVVLRGPHATLLHGDADYRAFWRDETIRSVRSGGARGSTAREGVPL
jgi:ATP-binding cassette subfamily B protein